MNWEKIEPMFFKERKKVPKHWYYISVDYCPLCSKDETIRERRYDERPEKYEDRHEFKESYDYCDAL